MIFECYIITNYHSQTYLSTVSFISSQSPSIFFSKFSRRVDLYSFPYTLSSIL